MRILLLFAGAMWLFSCAQGGKVEVLDPNAFESVFKQDIASQVVDVRTPGEYATGHIPGARLISVADPAFDTKAAQLDKNKPVLVYCATGVRSAAAAQQLQQMGFSKVYDLGGGIFAWRSAGKKITL